MKRILAVILVISMICTLAGCGSTGSSDNAETAAATEKARDEATEAEKAVSNVQTLDNVDYVMIYNPDIYDEKIEYNQSVNTGDFSKSVDININRADAFTEMPELTYFSQKEMTDLIGDVELNLSQDRAVFIPSSYKVGDKKEFYYELGTQYSMPLKTSFTCVSEGEHCYIWFRTGKNVDMNNVKKFVKEFDEVVYKTDRELFGIPRFEEEGGKINIVFQSMGQDSDTKMGYFCALDLCTPDEISEDYINRLGANAGHAMLHMNELLFDYWDKIEEASLYSTLAHELQHLICFSNVFNTSSGSEQLESLLVKQTPTWINESMSGYVEEVLYPGIQKTSGRYLCYANSNLIRHGQSLYNFDVAIDYESQTYDIGVYGSVFLFAEYLNDLAGKDVFSSMHDYWRKSYSYTLDDADALYHSVSGDVQDAIDKKYSYTDSLTFDSQEKAWMSKLTLDFYLSLMNFKDIDESAFEEIKPQTLLYDEVNPASIEGGGRVIVATKTGEFEIPDDAGKPLVYIGFDKDFNQTTDIVCQ